MFFNINGVSLGTFFAPNISGDQTFSFLGVSFTDPVVSRVRITTGNRILAPGSTATDLVVMDDFIYGEPVSASLVPEPASMALLAAGVMPFLPGLRRRMRRRAGGQKPSGGQAIVLLTRPGYPPAPPPHAAAQK